MTWILNIFYVLKMYLVMKIYENGLEEKKDFWIIILLCFLEKPIQLCVQFGCNDSWMTLFVYLSIYFL